MTLKADAEPEAPDTGLQGLPAALADIVCWVVFYLQRCSPEEVNLEVADELQRVIGDELRRLPVNDRLTFLQHATERAVDSSVDEYQGFLLELAETMGLE